MTRAWAYACLCCLQIGAVILIPIAMFPHDTHRMAQMILGMFFLTWFMGGLVFLKSYLP